MADKTESTAKPAAAPEPEQRVAVGDAPTLEDAPEAPVRLWDYCETIARGGELLPLVGGFFYEQEQAGASFELASEWDTRFEAYRHAPR